MAKETIVSFVKILKSYRTSLESCKTHYIFRTADPKVDTLWVSSFEDGIVTIDPMCGCALNQFSEIVVGCFAKESNFGDEVIKAFECDENSTFTGIKFTFNGVTLVVTKENADESIIYEEWYAGMYGSKC